MGVGVGVGVDVSVVSMLDVGVCVCVCVGVVSRVGVGVCEGVSVGDVAVYISVSSCKFKSRGSGTGIRTSGVVREGGCSIKTFNNSATCSSKQGSNPLTYSSPTLA